MPEFVAPYGPTLAAFAALGLLFLLQVLVLDVVSIRAGHTPGTPVAGGHDQLLFRATRAHANTIENLPVFLLLGVTAVLAGSNPWWVNSLTWSFVACRGAHMAAYYADLRTLRSASFGLGLLSLIGLLATVLVTLIA
jgi:prostaglandin-E synthase 1